jgi:AmmeMemoRadiSam system protein B
MHARLVRPPAVAGRFYSGDPDELAKEVDSHLVHAAEQQHAVGCMAPHAGYIYSGHVAGAVYGGIELPQRFIILGPNHTGQGAPLATALRGAWATPLGEAAIDEALAAEVARALPQLVDDPLAHQLEHSIEVQLPFLQRAVGEFMFLPICIGISSMELLLTLGDALAKAIQNAAEPVLLVCSSDLNHYEPDEITRIKDSHALAPMLALDAQQLYEVVHRERISMCGFAPAVATVHACATLGAKQGKLVKYATSADINHDRSYCVGYAGLVFA